MSDHAPPPTSPSSSSAPLPESADSLEIERKFLLRAMPELPAGAEVWHIEQGYLNPDMPPSDPKGGLTHGRLRRTRLPDGSVLCTHSIKTGSGIARTEIERVISSEQFERNWPRTRGRRLVKKRYRVPVESAGVVWEIDVFDGIELYLAEVELTRPDTPVEFPAWLSPLIVREVTDDPAYTNASIAIRLGSSKDQRTTP